MRYVHWSYLGVIAVGATLRVHALGAKSLWFDEAVSAAYLNFSPAEIVSRCAEPRAVHPPLYFVLLRAWAALAGDSEEALRALSSLFGLVTILGVYLLTRELTRFAAGPRAPANDAVGLLAACLVALSPLQIELSRTVRGYTMSTAALSLGGWILLRSLRDGGRYVHWLLVGVLAAVACHGHHLALFSVAANGLFGLAYLARRASLRRRDLSVSWGGAMLRDPAFRGAALACAVFALSYVVPCVPHLFAQSETVRHGHNSPITMKNVSRQVLLAICSSYDVDWKASATERWAAVGVVLGLVGYLAVRGGWGRWYLVLTGALPPALLILYSLGSDRTIVHARYLCFAQLSWLAGTALLVGDIPKRAVRTLLAAVLVLALVYACQLNWNLLGGSARPGMRAAVRYVLDHRATGEPVVAQTPYVFFGMKYYGRHAIRPLLCVRFEGRKGQYSSEQLLDEELITPERLVSLDLPGIWLISSWSYKTSRIVEPAIPTSWECVDFQNVEQDRFFERPIQIVHYRKRQGSVATTGP